ncbi:unnamed protein product [Caenorhabditis sp. 36 PRJEB53466]|nr:unnamed protein product [Caenorhabditis sp. 36 PRJEB53466]
MLSAKDERPWVDGNSAIARTLEMMADKEGQAAKRMRAIEEEAEKKRRKQLEFGGDDVTEVRHAEFNQTTLRLVNEFIERTSQPTSQSHGQRAHRTRSETIPRKKREEERLNPTPISCIICETVGTEEETISLETDDAALFLTATIIGANRDRKEATRKILGVSLRVCTWHVKQVCSMIITGLKLDESTMITEEIPMERLAEWCMIYKKIKTLKERHEDEDFTVISFKHFVDEFLNKFLLTEKNENYHWPVLDTSSPDNSLAGEIEEPVHLAEREHSARESESPALSEDMFSEDLGYVPKPERESVSPEFFPEDAPEPLREPSPEPLPIAAPVAPKPTIYTLPNGKKVMKLSSVVPNGQVGRKLIRYRVKRVVPHSSDHPSTSELEPAMKRPKIESADDWISSFTEKEVKQEESN